MRKGYSVTSHCSCKACVGYRKEATLRQQLGAAYNFVAQANEKEMKYKDVALRSGVSLEYFLWAMHIAKSVRVGV